MVNQCVKKVQFQGSKNVVITLSINYTINESAHWVTYHLGCWHGHESKQTVRTVVVASDLNISE